MSLLSIFDAVCLSFLLLCALDIIRQTNPLRHPFHAFGFVAMAIGAIGWILKDLSGIEPSWYSVLFHFGLAVYATLGAYALWAYKQEQSHVGSDSETPGSAVRAAVDVVATATDCKGRYAKGG